MTDTGLSRRTHVAVGALIAVCAVAIRLWAFGGITFGIGFDDGRYLSVAQNLSNGFLPTGPGEWFGTRVVLIWPIAAIFRLFGTSDYTAVAWPFVGSLVGVAAAYLVGRELAGARVGLVAAGLMAFAPLEVLFATRLRPDSWMPALIAIAVWCALRARRDGGPRLRWALGCGLALGAAWSVRESAPLMVPVLAMILWPARWRALAAAAAGAIAVPIACATAFAAIGGRFGQPLTSTAGTAVWRNPIAAWDANPSYTWMLWHGMDDPRSLLFLLGPVVVISAGLLIRRRPPAAVIPAIWFVWVALYLEVGTLVNVAKPVRYLTLCAIPTAVLVAMAVDGRWSFLAPIGLVVVAALALSPLPEREHRHPDVVVLNRVVDRLNELGPGPVLTEDYTWFVKLRAYRARSRLAVARVPEPTYLTREERLRNRRLRPLPRVEAFRGGFVVVGPVNRRSGWPLNWGIFRREVTRRVPVDRLELAATVDGARIYRWPASVPPLPSG